MSKAGERILASARQALAYARGEEVEGLVVHTPEMIAGYAARAASDDIDVRALRERLGLTQADFADRFGFGLDTVRNWERRRRRPGGAARTFLKVIEREPEAVQRALAG